MNQISPLAFVHPEAKLGDNNIIGPFCYIDRDTVIGDNNIFQNSVTVNVGARIGNGNEIFPGASISTKPQDLKFNGEITTCEVGNNNSIRENVTISRGTASKGTTKVGSNNLLMENMHVAHDCLLGNGLIIGNSTKFAGEVVIDDNAIVSAAILCHQFCHIGGYVMIQGGSRFSQDIPPYIIAGKFPVKYCGLNLIGLRRRGFSNELIEHIHSAYRLLYSKGIISEGINEIKNNSENDAFIKNSEIEDLLKDIESSSEPIVEEVAEKTPEVKIEEIKTESNEKTRIYQVDGILCCLIDASHSAHPCPAYQP